jgi:hypothetical protein
MDTWLEAYNNRSDLRQYGDNDLGLFALAIRFKTEDLSTVAANAITEGSDDKKCDLIHIDKEEGFAVIAQCFKSTKSKASAPANKASDLNTAIAWLLQRPIKELPERIRPAALELREAIIEGSVDQVYIWYVHNLPESKNVEQELKTVGRTAESILSSNFSGKKVVVFTQEIGTGTFEEWYHDTQSPILVSEKVEFKVSSGFEIKGDKWKAYVTAMPGHLLHGLYKSHGAKLFSANVRDYLGSRRSDVNINYGIKQTAVKSPENFWVFNNGLTVLVHSYDLPVKGIFKVTGISIVNGAQTTGALGSLPKRPGNEVFVPVRFVVTGDAETIFDIIQYNNSQNKVTASDFRSRDKIQKRLRDEVGKIPNAEYEGGRRGGVSDVIRRNPNLLPSYTVGQSLAAAQLDPDVAYNQKSNIWVEDRLYTKYFPEDITGIHLVFAYSLVRAVESRKATLVAKSKASEGVTEPEKRELDYFRQRGSIFLLVSAIASSIEIILGKRISRITKISFGQGCSPSDAKNSWAPIVSVCASFCSQLEEAFGDGLKSKEKIKKVLTTFQSLVQATATANAVTFKTFAQKVKV